MLNNPEFRRNLWLKLTGTQLVLHPVFFLILVALCWVLHNDTVSGEFVRWLESTFAFFGSVLLLGGGTLAAANSIRDEVREHTWDQQRLSALSPWQMAWGKLLGGTLHIWYGSLFYLLGLAACALTRPPEAAMEQLLRLLGLVLLALTLHSASMAAQLHTLNPNARQSDSDSVLRLPLLLLLLMGLMSLISTGRTLLISSGDDMESNMLFSWWFMQWSPGRMALVLGIPSCLLGLLALWRSMCTQLLVPTTPWAWILGNICLTLLLAGFAMPSPDSSYPQPADDNLHIYLGIILLLQSLALTYFMLLTQKNTLLHWKTIAFHIQQRDWQRCMQLLPLWPLSMLLALLGAILLFNSIPPRHTPPTLLWSAPLLLCLHLLRNTGIYLFFAWRNTHRSPLGLTLLTYFLLGIIFPLFTLPSESSLQVIILFEPLYALLSTDDDRTLMLAYIFIVIQNLIVAGLLAMRWRRYQSLAIPGQTTTAATPAT